MITLREFKIFMSGMITAFIVSVAVYNSTLNQQQIIANGVEIAVLTMVILLILTIAIQIFINTKKAVKEAMSK